MVRRRYRHHCELYLGVGVAQVYLFQYFVATKLRFDDKHFIIQRGVALLQLLLIVFDEAAMCELHCYLRRLHYRVGLSWCRFHDKKFLIKIFIMINSFVRSI